MIGSETVACARGAAAGVGIGAADVAAPLTFGVGRQTPPFMTPAMGAAVEVPFDECFASVEAALCVEDDAGADISSEFEKSVVIVLSCRLLDSTGL